MDGKKVVEVLFAQFGEEEFATREIPQDVMDNLAELMEISETGHARRSKIGRGLATLDDEGYILESGRKVRMFVGKPSTPRSFQLLSLGKPMGKGSAIELPGTEIAYEVVLVESEGYGWAAMCPALYGCVSQGEDEEDAIANITEAIIGWLKFAAIDGEKRKRKWLAEYREAGVPTKTVSITVPLIKANAAIH